MKLVIEMSLDSAAFEAEDGDDHSRNMEIVRLLSRAAVDIVKKGSLDEVDGTLLWDMNGVRVGKIRVEE